MAVGTPGGQPEVVLRSPTVGVLGAVFVIGGLLWVLGSFGAEVNPATSFIWATPGGLLGLFLGIRAFRMGVRVKANGLTIRNLGRTYDLARSEIQSVRVGRSNNITSSVSTIYVDTVSGKTIAARGLSSYSRDQVEAWRAELAEAAP